VGVSVRLRSESLKAGVVGQVNAMPWSSAESDIPGGTEKVRIRAKLLSTRAWNGAAEFLLKIEEP